MVDKEYQRITVTISWWVSYGFMSWILMNQVLYWNKATHSADPFCRLADLCVQRASMTLITYPQISTVFFLCCGTSAKHWKKTRSEGKTSSTLALYKFFAWDFRWNRASDPCRDAQSSHGSRCAIRCTFLCREVMDSIVMVILGLSDPFYGYSLGPWVSALQWLHYVALSCPLNNRNHVTLKAVLLSKKKLLLHLECENRNACSYCTCCIRSFSFLKRHQVLPKATLSFWTMPLWWARWLIQGRLSSVGPAGSR